MDKRPISNHFLWAALIYFLIGSLLGLLIRFHIAEPISFIKYKFIVHGHSHVILLGWVFNAIMGIMVYLLQKKGFILNRTFWLTIFWMMQLSIAGMMIFFPLQGYRLISIAFSTLHIFLALIVFGHLIKQGAIFRRNTWFLSWAWIFFLLSTLGPFSLGLLVTNGLAGSKIYYLTIYFYLHFLYNGFFVFSLIWLGIEFLKLKGIQLRNQSLILAMMVLSCFTGYSLSTLWSFPPNWVFILGWISALLQILAVAMLWKSKKDLLSLFSELKKLEKLILVVFVGSFLIKILLQLASAHLTVALIAYWNQYFIIGYLHLVFIGFVSFSLLYFMVSIGFLNTRIKRSTIGFMVLMIGFVLSELMIIAQPLGIRYYYHLLFLISSLLPLGIALIFPQKRDSLVERTNY